jgi:hypothetical protein
MQPIVPVVDAGADHTSLAREPMSAEAAESMARNGREGARARAADAYRPYARAGSVPELPEQCTKCQRWVCRERLAIMPVGASAWCSLCHAMDQVSGAIRESQISLEQEEQVLASLFQAYQRLRSH